MLVLHPHSQCDVCLDNYTTSREPYSIPCGHAFCWGSVAFVLYLQVSADAARLCATGVCRR